MTVAGDLRQPFNLINDYCRVPFGHNVIPIKYVGSTFVYNILCAYKFFAYDIHTIIIFVHGPVMFVVCSVLRERSNKKYA